MFSLHVFHTSKRYLDRSLDLVKNNLKRHETWIRAEFEFIFKFAFEFKFVLMSCLNLILNFIWINSPPFLSRWFLLIYDANGHFIVNRYSFVLLIAHFINCSTQSVWFDSWILEKNICGSMFRIYIQREMHARVNRAILTWRDNFALKIENVLGVYSLFTRDLFSRAILVFAAMFELYVEIIISVHFCPFREAYL